jgi:hypothetical protein
VRAGYKATEIKQIKTFREVNHKIILQHSSCRSNALKFIIRLIATKNYTRDEESEISTTNPLIPIQPMVL